MDQSVMTFGGTAARGSAIPTPAEGMVTYLEDSNSLQLWDGDGWTSAGGVSSGNAIINGAFEINQRGFTSSTVNGNFGFDRWRLSSADGTVTYSSQAFTAGTAPVVGYESTNFARVVVSGQTLASAQASIRQPIENVRTFAGQTVTLSFFAKAASGTPSITPEFAQTFGAGGSASVTGITGTKTQISTSWARYSFTLNIPSIAGKTIGDATNRLELVIYVSAGSDLNSRTNSLGIQNNTFDIWGVQLEAGPVATPFRRNANSLQGELAACQRYYYRTTASTIYAPFGVGASTSATNSQIFVNFPVTMRVAPTGIDFSTLVVSDIGSYNLAISAIVISNSTTNVVELGCTHATGATTNRSAFIRANNSTSGFLEFRAEL
jgi:hypothetical protein